MARTVSTHSLRNMSPTTDLYYAHTTYRTVQKCVLIFTTPSPLQFNDNMHARINQYEKGET